MTVAAVTIIIGITVAKNISVRTRSHCEKNAASGGKNDKFRFGGKIFGPDRKTHAAKSG
jgi:hypothetical protein